MIDKKQMAMIAAIRILSEGLTEGMEEDTTQEQDRQEDRSGQRGQVRHPETDRRLKENREAA